MRRAHSVIIPVLIFLISLIAISSCKEKVIKEEPVQANEFVSAYTSGQVSSESVIRVVLNLPEELSGIVNSNPPKNVFRLKPDVEGKTFWADQNTLMFEPEQPLKNGKTYEVLVDLGKLLGIKDAEIGEFKFYVEVKELTFSVVFNELRPYQNRLPEKNYLQGHLTASDVFDVKLLDQFLSASQGNKSLKIQYEEEPISNTFRIVIDSVERLMDQSVVSIKWESREKVFGFNSDSEIDYFVPSLNNFEFVKVNVFNDDDQYVKLEFSDPIDPGQNLDGLVYFSDDSPFKLKVETNSILLYPTSRLVGENSIVIKKEVRKSKKIQLKNDILQSVFFGQVKPQVRFTSNGTIMPGTDGWILPFEAVNLNAVDVIITKIYTNNIQQFLQVNTLSGRYQLNRVGSVVHREKIDLSPESVAENWQWIPYAIDLSKMINQEPGAIYRVDLRFKKSYASYTCDENESLEEEEANDYYYTSDYYYPQDYSWGNQDDPCSNSYYNHSRFVQRNVMASNIGLTIKEDADRLLVYANNLGNTSPMSGVKIILFDYQQHKLVSSITNQKGVASLKGEGEPYLLVAEMNGQFAYQRLDGGSALSYSKFETEGVNIEKGMKGFIYGERGVWRPGDTLFLTLILDDRENPLPKGHPVTLKLTNPRGKEVERKTSISGMNGFYTFQIPTSSEAMTGFWTATAEVGGAVFTKTLRIETIKPNRLKIELEFDKTLLTVGKNKIEMLVKWLHGGKASNLKADVNVSIRPGKTSFEKFEKFNFDDPARSFYPEEYTIFEDKLNAQGEASFDFDLSTFSYAPGMLKVNFSSKVYEQGGDFSIDQTSMDFAPFDYFVGISGPDPGNNYLEVDKEHQFEIATVSNTGEAISVENLEYEVYKLDWSWWYESNNRNLGSYISSQYDRIVESGVVSTRNGKGKFNIKVNYPGWGWFYIKVKSRDDGHQTGMKIYLDWPSWYSRESRKAPGSMSLLSLTTDKEEYAVGEEVKVSVPTPANARLLVSLEKGDGQLKSWQMEADTKETLISFEATGEMAPNVYLSVSVLQPHAQTINDLPIRMYGVVPVMVKDANTVLKPKLELPKSVRPGEIYTVKASEESNKNMTYTLAIVDEGLLDLTHFKTPSPHKYFYAKEALSVRTWDFYEDVMGAFGGRLEKVFAIGGDMEMEADSDKKKANRFKPVVAFLGPFELKAGETKSHKIKMPNYVGSVKCMLVAGENGAYGHTSNTMTVKQPLMVLGTLPRVLAPGESLKLPVSVFVLDEKIKSVEVNLETNEFFKLGKSNQTLTVSEMGEYMAYFDLEVALKQGIGKVKVTVSSGNEKAFYEVEIQVENPNPRVFEVTHHMLQPGEKWSESIELVGIEGTNELNLTVSGIPPLNLEKRLQYLIRYPYGCVEQTTSSVFPQLYLDKLVELDANSKKRIEQNIKNGIYRLSRMHSSDGGFSYWPGARSSTDWGTSYAGHFLLLAKEKGYQVSPALINSWELYQKQASNNWMESDGYSFSQAYRLYTLALAGKPNMSAMNRLRSKKNLDASSRYRLAAAYALVGQKEVAVELIRSQAYEPEENDKYWHRNYGSETRDQAMIVETYILLNEYDEAIPFFNLIAERLKSEYWMSTQTTAFSLYAFSLFVDDGSEEKGIRFLYDWKDQSSGEIRIDFPIFSTKLDEQKTGKLMVENTSEKNLFVTLTKSGIPAMGETASIQKNLELEVKYFDMGGNPIDVSDLAHGTDFYARVTVQNPGAYGWLENLALTQIFPSGWEIINTRMLDLGASLKSDKSDYIDYRDDRVNTFFPLNRKQKKSFVVLLNAAYQGKFYLPATQCGAMYNNEVVASTGGRWINVSK